MPRKGQMLTRLDPAWAVTELDVAWAAGVYEGEGSYDGGNTTLHVDQKDPWLVFRLRDLFGGSYFQYAIRSKTKKYPQWRWQICGERARIFLRSIFPYLSPRRKEQVWRYL